MRTRNKINRVGLLLMSTLISTAIQADPVRVVVIDNEYAALSELGCPNNNLNAPDCRVHLKLHCSTGNEKSCVVNESAHPANEHPTIVSSIALDGNDDVELITARGSLGGVLKWIKTNHATHNIRVLTETRGVVNDSNAGSCSNIPLINDLYNRGVVTIFASGNQGYNGLNYKPGLGQAAKGVIPNSCAHNALSIGLTGLGFVSGSGSSLECVSLGTGFGDGGPRPRGTRVPLSCKSNASSETDFVARSGSFTSNDLTTGTSFSAPNVASAVANYFTHFPNKTSSQAVSFLNSMSTNLAVVYPNTNLNDTYKNLNISSINTSLNATSHTLKEGYWYNPERPGWGLFIAEKDDVNYMTWYTYHANGSPVWYTAGGQMFQNRLSSQIGRTTKPEGGAASTTQFGNITIDAINDEEAYFSWNFAGQEQNTSGTERIVHISSLGGGVHGSYNGLWYNRDDSGWGISTQFSTGFSGRNFTALYYFDLTGKPVWAASSENNVQGDDTMDYEYYMGFCMGCPWVDVGQNSIQAGYISHDYDDGEVLMNITAPTAWPRPNEPVNQGWVDIINLTYE